MKPIPPSLAASRGRPLRTSRTFVLLPLRPMSGHVALQLLHRSSYLDDEKSEHHAARDLESSAVTTPGQVVSTTSS